MPIWDRYPASARNRMDGHRRKTYIVHLFACLWAVKRHNPRLAGKYRQIPSFTMSNSNRHAFSCGETEYGRRPDAGLSQWSFGDWDGGARRDRTDDLKL